MSTDKQDPLNGQAIVYINHWMKDLSLEMKNNLIVSIPEGEAPRADINLEIGATKLQRQESQENFDHLPQVYEVSIRVTVNVGFGQEEKKVNLLKLEAECAGAFYLNNQIPADKLDYFIYVKCAEMILPYARCYVDQALSFSSVYEPISLKRMDINLEEMFSKGKQSKDAPMPANNPAIA